MRRIVSVLAVVALLAAMMIAAPVAMAQLEEPNPKFCVVHNPNNPHVISVDEAGLREHIEHGDLLFIPEPVTGCPEDPAEIIPL